MIVTTTNKNFILLLCVTNIMLNNLPSNLLGGKTSCALLLAATVSAILFCSFNASATEHTSVNLD